jgi:hypothetical protein
LPGEQDRRRDEKRENPSTHAIHGGDQAQQRVAGALKPPKIIFVQCNKNLDASANILHINAAIANK